MPSDLQKAGIVMGGSAGVAMPMAGGSGAGSGWRDNIAVAPSRLSARIVRTRCARAFSSTNTLTDRCSCRRLPSCAGVRSFEKCVDAYQRVFLRQKPRRLILGEFLGFLGQTLSLLSSSLQ